MEVVNKRFEEFGYHLCIDESIIPNDDSTNFICSGMQQVKDKFGQLLDGSKYSSLQTCIRTNDLSEIGDGTHLSLFKMIGNFQFGCNEYKQSIEMWHLILTDLKIPITHITVHPSQKEHISFWTKLGYKIELLEDNTWSDGNIGGYCCEVFVDDLEIGNLVHTLGHSVDVGFGLERLIQIVENKSRVDESSLFRTDLHPIVRDHIRILEVLYKNNIVPGSKGRNYICKLFLRKLLDFEINETFIFSGWLENERVMRQKRFVECRRALRKQKNKEKPLKWWLETYGIDENELNLLKKEKGYL